MKEVDAGFQTSKNLKVLAWHVHVNWESNHTSAEKFNWTARIRFTISSSFIGSAVAQASRRAWAALGPENNIALASMSVEPKCAAHASSAYTTDNLRASLDPIRAGMDVVHRPRGRKVANPGMLGPAMDTHRADNAISDVKGTDGEIRCRNDPCSIEK